MESEFDFYLEYQHDKKLKSIFIQESSDTLTNELKH